MYRSTEYLVTDSVILVAKKIIKITLFMLELTLNFTCNRYEVTLHGSVQNSKLNTVLTNRINTLRRIRQVDEPTRIKTDEDIVPIICQTFHEFGMDIAHIDYGEDIVYSIGTYIRQITYYITIQNDIVEQARL